MVVHRRGHLLRGFCAAPKSPLGRISKAEAKQPTVDQPMAAIEADNPALKDVDVLPRDCAVRRSTSNGPAN